MFGGTAKGGGRHHCNDPWLGVGIPARAAQDFRLDTEKCLVEVKPFEENIPPRYGEGEQEGTRGVFFVKNQ